MQENPEEWIEYHKLYREACKSWKVIPYEKMIEGKAKIMEILGEDRVFNIVVLF
jgi:hypothetical protein